MTSKIWFDPEYYGMSQSERKLLLEFFFKIVQNKILNWYQRTSSKGIKLPKNNIDFLGRSEIDKITKLGLEISSYILKNFIIPYSKKFTSVGDYSETENKLHMQIKLIEFFNILQIALHKYTPKQLSADELWSEELDDTCRRFWESK